LAKKKNKGESLIESLLGFTPGEDIIKWVFEEYSEKKVSFKEIERMFILDIEPNYYTGVILSAYDLCEAKVFPNQNVYLPPVNMSNSRRQSGKGSFIEEYIQEISVFPTLNREEELNLAKGMEVAYLRYKNSLCFCPAILDFLDDEFKKVRETTDGKNNFNLSYLKKLVIPGVNKLGYDSLWKLIEHQWDKIMQIRMEIKDLGIDVHNAEEVSQEKQLKLKIYKFAVAFLLKDLNIKENVFHELRTKLEGIESYYPHLKKDFRRVRNCYDAYIEYKNLLVNYNLKLVVSIARKFFKPKFAPMDIIQYGNEGLIRAAEDYNYKLNFKFSTYAIWWIRQKIQEGLQEQEHMIRIPAYRLHLSRKYSAIKGRLSREGEDFGDEALSKELDLSVEQINKLKSDPSAFVLSPNISSDGEESDALEQMVDTSSIEEDKTYDEEAVKALKSHLKLYPVRERFILALRYGLTMDGIHPEVRDISEIEEEIDSYGDMGDEDLDDKIEPIPFSFNGLSTELIVENDDLKAIKTNSKAEPDVAKKIIPYTDSELKDIKKEAKNNPNLEARESTLLALLEGRQFEEYVGFKLRNRIILKKIWLKMSLRPSVVRKIINNEGLILDDVATVFGLTKERVRQIEAKVLRNISYHLVLP
jgi:RNA polymerase sigma factor (sigma-70 family)